MKKINNHIRVNDTLLGFMERPVLRWLAERMPLWMTPDRCTAVGVFGSVLVLLGFFLSNWNVHLLWIACFGFILDWFGDSLDGTLARYRHIERPKYGFYIDHTKDLVCQAMIFLGLGLTPLVKFEIACLLLISYLMLSLLAYIRTCVFGEFKISYNLLGPTEFRVVAILFTAAMYFLGPRMITLNIWVIQAVMSIYDVIIIVATLIIFFLFIQTMWKQARALAKTDR